MTKTKTISLALIALALSGCVSNNQQASTSTLKDKAVQSDVIKNKAKDANATDKKESLNKLANVDTVLSQSHHCNESIVIRSQSLSQVQIESACKILVAQEAKFHQTFNTLGKPVADDNNKTMRANIYTNRAEFVKYATAHFTMPTNNGGMYLEGYPDKPGNRAEFVAYERKGQIWNLSHEFVHYLDGRFNKYGDYCNGLHDDHAGPEFCPTPHRGYPHIVWWAEGIAEYIAHGKNNEKAATVGKKQTFALSELFNTSSNENTGAERVYRWGYLATRFMMENHRKDIDEMLVLVRAGDWHGYQVLVRGWGTNFDKEFKLWLISI